MVSSRLGKEIGAMSLVAQVFEVRSDSWYADIVDYILHAPQGSVIVHPVSEQIEVLKANLMSQHNRPTDFFEFRVTSEIIPVTRSGLSQQVAEAVRDQVTMEGRYQH
jgi:hypothetical protein